jgi:Holliday junction resolvase RusA-like endonuclease
MIQFFIPGKPEALKRHRTFRRGAHNVNIDPSARAKDNFLLQAMQYKPDKPLDCPITMILEFQFQRPKSHFRSNGQLKDSAPTWHTSRPDKDNLEKFVMDSLNQVFYRDDSLVCRGQAQKIYSDVPGVSVVIVDADAEYFGFVNGNPV